MQLLPNQLTVTLIVVFLGLITLFSLGAISYIVAYRNSIESGEIVLISSYGTTALGGLIGLLGGTAVRNGTQLNGKKVPDNAGDKEH